MGLKGLGRPPVARETPPSSLEKAVEEFIAGAPVTTVPTTRKRKRKPTFVRTTFSLSKEVNKQIDKISLYPRSFKCTRSDVVRAGVVALMSMERQALVQLLEQVSGSESIDDVMQDE